MALKQKLPDVLGQGQCSREVARLQFLLTQLAA